MRFSQNKSRDATYDGVYKWHCHTMVCLSDIGQSPMKDLSPAIYTTELLLCSLSLHFLSSKIRVTRTTLIPTYTGFFFKLVWYAVCTLVFKLMHPTVTKRMKGALLWEIAMITIWVNKIWKFIFLTQLHFHWDWWITFALNYETIGCIMLPSQHLYYITIFPLLI